MFRLLGRALALTLALVTTGAWAQTVTLDNVAPIALSTSNTSSAVSINAQTGNVIVRSSGGNYTSCTAQQANPPSITNFSPTAASVQPGTNIQLNWSTQNASSCTPQLGGSTIWSSLGTLQPNGSQTFAAPGTVGSITFQITCTNGTQNVSQSTVVNVENTVNNCPAAFVSGTEASWQGVFGTSWPSYGVNTRVNVVNQSYIAFSFTASAVSNQFGTVGTSTFPGDGDGLGQMSISRFPGCFSAQHLNAGCLGTTSRSPSISWVNGTAQNRCSLTQGQTYWVNLTYSGYQGNGANCPSASCGADVANFQQD